MASRFSGRIQRPTGWWGLRARFAAVVVILAAIGPLLTLASDHLDPTPRLYGHGQAKASGKSRKLFRLKNREIRDLAGVVGEEPGHGAVGGDGGALVSLQAGAERLQAGGGGGREVDDAAGPLVRLAGPRGARAPPRTPGRGDGRGGLA